MIVCLLFFFFFRHILYRQYVRCMHGLWSKTFGLHKICKCPLFVLPFEVNSKSNRCHVKSVKPILVSLSSFSINKIYSLWSTK